MSDPIDAEIVSPSQPLAIRPSQEVAPSGLFGTQDPAAVIGKARIVAQALKDVIVKQGLVSKISGKEYPRCEAWTLLGTMLGVFPVLAWSRPVEGGWEARVEAKTKDGATIGAAEAQCLRAERNWSNRDDFALRSMAQTRATAKCLRMPLGFVMNLSGFEVTPAEEMVADHPTKAPKAEPLPPKPAVPAKPVPFPTEESRTKMIATLKAGPGGPNREIVTEYFRKLADPTPLAPFEQLEELKLIYVPATAGQMKALSQKLTEFGNGDRAAHAFPPHPEPSRPIPPAVTTPAQVVPKIVANASQPKDPEWWRDFIIPIPPKGVKRDAYLKHPQTIGQLFDMRHGESDESQEARQRLWGFANHFEPKGWTKRSGEVMPPSETDVKFREALDAFWEYFQREHPGEKL